MKLKKKHIITGIILLLLVLIFSTLYSLTFTDIIVKPKYIFSAEYNGEYYDRKHKVELSSINAIEITYSDYRSTKNNLKYCNNLSKLVIDSPDYDNMNFLYDLNHIDVLITRCESEDWQGISGCKNLKSITMYSSDFSDLNLFTGFSELSELQVESNKRITYGGFETMMSLKTLVLAVQNTDIKEISKASQISELEFHCLKETLNVDCFSDMNNLETLWFGACDIQEETLSEISEIENLKSVYFGNCKFQCSEEDYNKHISDISAKGIDVKDEDNIFLS